MTKEILIRKCSFEIEFVNCKRDDFLNDVFQYGVSAVRFPTSQSSDLAWNVLLSLGDGALYFVAGKSCSTDAFNEYFFLSFERIKSDDARASIDLKTFLVSGSAEFHVDSIAILYYEDNDMYLEGGITLNNCENRGVSIVVAPSPGAVAIADMEQYPTVNSDLNFSQAKVERKK